MLFPGQVMGQPGESGEVWGWNGSQTGTQEKKRREYGKRSVPQRPVALGNGVGDVQEGRAHQVEGFVTEG